MTMWVGFLGFVGFAVLADLVLVKPEQLMHFHVAAAWSGFWVAAAMGFAGMLYKIVGARQAALFITGYFVEESLSIDNLVVFVLIFKEFRTPSDFQHTALLYGVTLSIALRVVFIFFGTWLLSNFRFVMVLFGGFLVYTGLKMAGGGGGSDDIGAIRKSTNAFLAAVGVDVDHEWSSAGGIGFRRNDDGKFGASPMLPLFLCIGMCDIMFAFDSIPAILGITEDLFLVVTSNAFAVLGLRSLYWCLAALHSRFNAIQHALSAALVSVGLKMASGYFEYNLGGSVYGLCAATVMAVSVWPDQLRAVATVVGLVQPSRIDTCLLYTSDAADEEDSVDLGGRRIIKKKKSKD
eukprot:TRINITY_DN22685_c0_g1_i1.p1 TRINITY_DN22685_c0_g1~~TRINITY_DN22685_c0_g1_i1.p1  ORF type:complete len:349 (+),score=90.97 TRINITY_DN22685_c0_g1_i1:267-1313(+)